MEKPIYMNDIIFNSVNSLTLGKIIGKICDKNMIKDLASHIKSYIGCYMTYEVIAFDNYPG